jgi:hypothetical protein
VFCYGRELVDDDFGETFDIDSVKAPIMLIGGDPSGPGKSLNAALQSLASTAFDAELHTHGDNAVRVAAATLQSVMGVDGATFNPNADKTFICRRLRFAAYLLNHVKFVDIQVTQNDDPSRLFDVVNRPGAPLFEFERLMSVLNASLAEYIEQNPALAEDLRKMNEFKEHDVLEQSACLAVAVVLFINACEMDSASGHAVYNQPHAVVLLAHAQGDCAAAGAQTLLRS